MKTKKRITLLALLFAFITTGGMFAYWATSVQNATATTNPKITIGVGEAVSTTLSITPEVAGGFLVPAGFANTERNYVEEIVVTYTINLTSNQNAAEGTTATLTITNNSTLNDLINVNIVNPTQEIVVDGEAKTIEIRITLSEPANREEYLAVADTEFTLNFSLLAEVAE